MVAGSARGQAPKNRPLILVTIDSSRSPVGGPLATRRPVSVAAEPSSEGLTAPERRKLRYPAKAAKELAVGNAKLNQAIDREAWSVLMPWNP